jgi:hypothetical protein
VSARFGVALFSAGVCLCICIWVDGRCRLRRWKKGFAGHYYGARRPEAQSPTHNRELRVQVLRRFCVHLYANAEQIYGQFCNLTDVPDATLETFLQGFSSVPATLTHIFTSPRHILVEEWPVFVYESLFAHFSPTLALLCESFINW